MSAPTPSLPVSGKTSQGADSDASDQVSLSQLIGERIACLDDHRACYETGLRLGRTDLVELACLADVEIVPGFMSALREAQG